MPPIDDLHLYLEDRLPLLELDSHGQIIPSSQARLRQWLEIAQRTLSGYTAQACVIRRTRSGEQVGSQVRRWSENRFLPLQPPAEMGRTLMLGQDGLLYLRQRDGQRSLRHNPEEEIVDEIYAYQPLENPSLSQLEMLRHQVLLALYPLGYASWPQLSPSERERLVSHAGSGREAQTALAALYSEDQIPSLELFLGPLTSPQMRQEVWQMGVEGQLQLNPQVLAWILRHPQWNRHPQLVQRARHLLAQHSAQTALLIFHPDRHLRQRLADLLDNVPVLLEWLSLEDDLEVRAHLLLSLERLNDLERILACLEEPAPPEASPVTESKPPQPKEIPPSVVGWVLANWRRAPTPTQWQLLLKALERDLGDKNKAALRSKLQAAGFKV